MIHKAYNTLKRDYTPQDALKVEEGRHKVNLRREGIFFILCNIQMYTCCNNLGQFSFFLFCFHIFFFLFIKATNITISCIAVLLVLSVSYYSIIWNCQLVHFNIFKMFPVKSFNPILKDFFLLQLFYLGKPYQSETSWRRKKWEFICVV